MTKNELAGYLMAQADQAEVRAEELELLAMGANKHASNMVILRDQQAELVDDASIAESAAEREVILANNKAFNAATIMQAAQAAFANADEKVYFAYVDARAAVARAQAANLAYSQAADAARTAALLAR